MAPLAASSGMPNSTGKDKLAPLEPVWSQPWTAAPTEARMTVKMRALGWSHLSGVSGGQLIVTYESFRDGASTCRHRQARCSSRTGLGSDRRGRLCGRGACPRIPALRRSDPSPRKARPWECRREGSGSCCQLYFYSISLGRDVGDHCLDDLSMAGTTTVHYPLRVVGKLIVGSFIAALLIGPFGTTVLVAGSHGFDW